MRLMDRSPSSQRIDSTTVMLRYHRSKLEGSIICQIDGRGTGGVGCPLRLDTFAVPVGAREVVQEWGQSV